MRSIHSFLFSIILAVSGISQNDSIQSIIIDQVVGQVGSEIILLSDVENNLKQFSAQQKGKIPPNSECFILENLMIQKLLVNQANLDSVIVTDEEVQSQVDMRVDRILGMMNNDRDYFISYYSKTPEEMRTEMQDDIKNLLLEERMREEILNSITITPTEVKSFFNSIPKDSLPYYDSEVEVSEIVINPTPNDSAKQRTYNRLEKILDRINNGESFEELAANFSDDPGSGPQGGNLGWAVRGQFVPEFEAAAYKLDQDEISPIVETQFGYHIIQLLERRGNRIRLRHILLTIPIDEADKILAVRKLDSIKNLIEIDTFTFEEAVLRFSDEKSQSFTNGGRIINPQSGDTYFSVGDLDPDIYFSIDTMEVGEISEPLEYLTQQGEVGYRLIKLVSKTDPHQANLKQDYAKIQDIAKNSKKNEFLMNWFMDKIQDTYVELDDNLFQYCENVTPWVNKEEIPKRP